MTHLMTMDYDRGFAVVVKWCVNPCVEQVNIFVGESMKTESVEELRISGILRLTHLFLKNYY